MAPWLVAGILAGCSASQSSAPKVPTPPAPPSVPEAPTPSEPSSSPSSSPEAGETEATNPKSGSETSAPSAEPAQGEGSGESGPDKVEAEPEAQGSAGATPADAVEPTASPSPGLAREGSGAASSSAKGAETSEERRDGLNEKLDASLREFDGLILKERELLDGRRQEDTSRSGETSGASGTGRAGDQTGELEGTSAEAEAQMAGGTGASPDQAPSDEDPEAGPTTMGGDPAADQGKVPEDVGDGRDDDIVARQLREAAMNEENPALRERLWDEYRAYKRGTK